MKKQFIVPLTALVVIVLDQLTKLWLVSAIPLREQRVVIEGFLQLRHTQNTGAAFGFFQGGTVALSVAAVAIVAAIVYSATRMGDGNGWGMFALSLIVGGALGNLIDRLRLGYVVDFIEVYGPHVKIGNSIYTWPVFNVADSAITVGVLILLATILFAGRAEPHATVVQPEAGTPPTEQELT